MARLRDPSRERWWAVGLALLLSVPVVYLAYEWLGWDYLQDEQIGYHDAVLAGEGGDPYQYRVFAEWLIEAFFVPFELAGLGDNAEPWGFLTSRYALNAGIFVLAWAFYRRLGLGRGASFLGVGLLGWATANANYDASLVHNSYFELLAYFVAALLVLHERYWWVVPLTVVAALNRETAAYIPVMLLAVAVQRELDGLPARRAALAGVGSAAAFLATFATTRGVIGPSDVVVTYGHTPGLNMLDWNINQPVVWTNLFLLVNILPILALASLRRWHPVVKAWGLAIVPVWVVSIFWLAAARETRLFLVPLALVIIPGALAGLRAGAPPGPARRLREVWAAARTRIAATLRDVGPGRLTVIAGAELLLVATMWNWYTVGVSYADRTETFTAYGYLDRTAYGFAGLAMVLLLALVAGMGRRALLARAGLALLLFAVVGARVFDPPGENSLVDVHAAAYLGAAGAFIALLGALLDLLRSRGAESEAEPVLRSRPARPRTRIPARTP